MRIRYLILAGVMIGSGATAADIRTMDCTVEQLAIYQDRVHIRRAKPQSLDSANQPIYFAAAAGSPMAGYLVSAISGFVTAAQTATVKGKITSDTVSDVGGGQQITTDKGTLYGSVISPTNLRVRVTYDFNDTSGTAYGCLAADCRGPLSIAINYK